MESHENEKPKEALECSICFRTLANKRTLKKHMASHTNEKPYTCKICNKSFKDKLYVKKHFESVHMTFAEECINCVYCSKTFKKLDSIKSHMKRQHRGLPLRGNFLILIINYFTELLQDLSGIFRTFCALAFKKTK